MKLIDEKELAQLIVDSYKLACLESAGVDNWEGWDEAFDSEISGTAEYFRKLEEMSDEEITKDYQTFNDNLHE